VLVFPAAPRLPSDHTRVTRTAFPPSAILGATRASVPPNVSPALAPCVHEYTVFRLASQARALLPDLPPLPSYACLNPVTLAEVATFLNSIGSHLRDGKVVFAPPMKAALTLIFTVADNFPELILGPAEAVKAELFSAIKLLKLPPFVHGSLVYEVAKELMRRLEEEVIGYLRLSTQLLLHFYPVLFFLLFFCFLLPNNFTLHTSHFTLHTATRLD